MLRNWALALRPTLSLDFLAGLNDSRITYSGGANGTRVNSSGVIVAATTPRFDYDPVTLACKGLLIEESRTNLQLNSEDISGWAVSDCSITSNQTAAPNGNVTADLITENSASAEHFAYGSQINISSIPYSQTFFLKSNGRNAQVRVQAASPFAYIIVNVNLAAGTVGNPAVYLASNASATISHSANGFYRVTVTGTFDVSVTGVYPIVYTTNGSSTNYQGDGVSGVYVWGQQFEAGSFATSYIPTTSASVTRTADSAVMTGTNFSSWYNQSEGTFVVGFDSVDLTGFPHALSVSDGTNNEALLLRLNAGTSQFVVFDGGAVQANLFSGNASSGTAQKMAASYATNNFAFTRNSATLQTDVSGSLPTPNAAQIGAAPGGGAYLNGHLRSISYYPTARPNSLQALTS